VIDIAQENQWEMKSHLGDTYAPCFINGECKFVSIGDFGGNFEVWDVALRMRLKRFEIETKQGITSSASIKNILAIGSGDKTLRLYDVRNWKCFYQQKFDCNGDSLSLTEDLKYVTFAGKGTYGNEKCVVLEIE